MVVENNLSKANTLKKLTGIPRMANPNPYES
jgi:hypothetical protein